MNSSKLFIIKIRERGTENHFFLGIKQDGIWRSGIPAEELAGTYAACVNFSLLYNAVTQLEFANISICSRLPGHIETFTYPTTGPINNWAIIHENGVIFKTPLLYRTSFNLSQNELDPFLYENHPNHREWRQQCGLAADPLSREQYKAVKLTQALVI